MNSKQSNIKKLELKNYKMVIPLLKSNNELSVFSVVEGNMPGEIYVNSIEAPTAALIQTSECNLVAGDPNDKKFNQFIGEQLDFWDSITPDIEAWCEVIPKFHPDKFIRRYIRHHYLLESSDYISSNPDTPEGYILEQIDPEKLRKCSYENADEVLKWMENWEDDKAFQKYGVGTYLRNENTIVSWSLSDCAWQESIAIGIHTDENYRNKGFGRIAAEETIRQCLEKGYKKVEWLCVDINKGSNTLATSLGFNLNNKYVSFVPYAPVENLTDLSERQWEEWAEYFEQAAKEEPRLFEECIYTYVKANNPQKVKELLQCYENKKSMEAKIDRFALYLHTMGMAGNFRAIF